MSFWSDVGEAVAKAGLVAGGRATADKLLDDSTAGEVGLVGFQLEGITTREHRARSAASAAEHVRAILKLAVVGPPGPFRLMVNGREAGRFRREGLFWRYDLSASAEQAPPVITFRGQPIPTKMVRRSR